MDSQYCGYVSIIGKPNVGKSTIINSILNKKVSITSRKSQTTRNNIIGFNNLRGLSLSALDAIPPLKRKFVRKMSYGA